MPGASSAPLILVVDDEPCVLSSISGVLAHFGFAVLQAASADEALKIAREFRSPIDLLLSDVIMPRVSGPALARQFLRIHPETQCLFMAGMPDHPEVVDGISGRGLPFLPKPFLPTELVSKVRQVLDGGAIACGASA